MGLHAEFAERVFKRDVLTRFSERGARSLDVCSVQLHKDHHWSYDQSEEWMNTTLTGLLLEQGPTTG